MSSNYFSIRVQCTVHLSISSSEQTVIQTQSERQWRHFLEEGALTMDAMKNRHVHATTLSVLCHVPGLN